MLGTEQVVRWVMLAITAAITAAQEGCDFPATAEGDVSLCSLLTDTTPFAVAPFRTGTGQGTNWIGGPSLDASDQNTGGFAFSIAADMVSGGSVHKKAWLVTDPAPPSGPQGKCLSFSYAISGLSIERLSVALLTYQTPNPSAALQNLTEPITFHRHDLWKTRESTAGEWRTATVTFSAVGDYSVAFEAVPDQRYVSNRAYVALDNIVFRDGPCDNDCMFDFDFCGWRAGDGAQFEWQLARGSDKPGTGPSRDQSSWLNTDKITGGYAYIDSDYPRMPAQVARLQSAELVSATPLCVSFWLNMHGGGIGGVRLLLSPSDNPSDLKELWSLTSVNQGLDTWNPGQQTVYYDTPFTLVFEASVGLPGAGDIALDTIAITEGACPSLPQFSSATWGDCTFFQDTCGWDMEFHEDAPCNMLSRVAESIYNPPGHTEHSFLVTDLYMQWDLSCYSDRPRHAVSLSKAVDVTTDTCLTFWVFMFTNVPTETAISAISVVLISSQGNQTLWRLENQQQASWTFAQVTVPAVGASRVALTGTKGRSLLGMVGVDDIAVFPGTCEVQPAQAKVEVGDCSFDLGECGWRVVNQDPTLTAAAMNWRHADGRNVLGLNDHTFNADEGGYMYLDAFNTELTSRLRSPGLQANTTLCLSFYFATFYRDSLAYLSVVRDTSTGPQVLWRVTQASLPEESKLAWVFARIEVEETTSVYFEGRVREGGWAIDDVTLKPAVENCIRTPASSVPTP